MRNYGEVRSKSDRGVCASRRVSGDKRQEARGGAQRDSTEPRLSRVARKLVVKNTRPNRVNEEAVDREWRMEMTKIGEAAEAAVFRAVRK